jgi:ribonuclease HII
MKGEIGVDEAGRGPMAGPVVAAAVMLPPHHPIEGLGDSKKLPEARRETLFDEIVAHASIGVGIASAARIDALNIRGATLWAMGQAVLALNRDVLVHRGSCAVLVDGRDAIPDCALPCQPIIKGDGLHQSIAAASIIAKVTRDRLMVRASATYPAYGFAGHKGYPTAAHRAALIRHGACPLHRRSFGPVRACLA